MTPPRLDVSLRVEIPSPLKGAPRAAGQSPFHRVCRHGLLRGLRGSGLRASFVSCGWRASAVEN
jgi:hypothetical protein